MKRLATRFVTAAALATILLAGACTPMGTYPPVEGAMDLGTPGFEPVPTLMVDAIRFAHEHYNDGQDEVVINLPPRTPASVYGRVIRELGAGRAMNPDDTRAYHVQQVRVRGLNAEVDLIYPRTDEGHELVTIKLRKPLVGPYRVTDTRLWRIHVDVPSAHYLATPEQPAPVVTAPATVEPSK